MNRSFPTLALLAVAASLSPGCSCSRPPAMSGCAVDDDCRGQKCDPGTIPQCKGGACGCQSDIVVGDVGRYQSMALRGPIAYVAAYNATYGDLMIGHISPPGRINEWEFVDGVPASATAANPLSRVRGGITDEGDDVGRYASIAINANQDPVVAYYDCTHQSLKFASFGVVRWDNHVVDAGSIAALPHCQTSGTGDDFGRWASLSLDRQGVPGIAYYAEVKVGASGKREGQLRWAQAKTPYPSAKSDWTVTIVETREIPDLAMGAPANILPDGIALFCSAARKGDGSPVVAYYDRLRGNLRYAEFDSAAKAWKTPVVLDGEDAMGKDTGDVGQYPSVAVDRNDVAHITYVDAGGAGDTHPSLNGSHDNLLYVDSMNLTPEVVDDGYRSMDEQTTDGLPAPVYHLIGDSSSIQVVGDTVSVAYQDSTTLQLRFGSRDPKTLKWTLQTIAGHATPFSGSYGFYAQNRLLGTTAVLSSYGIDQHHINPDYFVEVFGQDVGGIM